MPTTDPGGIQDDGDLRSEGSAATVTLTKTLWSLASKWGAGGVGSPIATRSRDRTSAPACARTTTPTRADVDDLAARIPTAACGRVSASATRQWGEHAASTSSSSATTCRVQTPSLLPNFHADPVLRQLHRRTCSRTPSSSRTRSSSTRSSSRSYKTVRNVDTFELAEDVRLGPDATVGRRAEPQAPRLRRATSPGRR